MIPVVFPIQVAAAIRTEVKADPVAAIGATLVNVSRALEPHAVLKIGRAEMEGGAGSALASLAVAQINPLGFASDDRAAIRNGILPFSPSLLSRALPQSVLDALR